MRYYIDIQGFRADGSPDYVLGSIRADSLAEAERRAEKEARGSGIVKVTKKVVEPT